MLYIKLFSLGLACGHTSFSGGPTLKYSGVDYYSVAAIFKPVHTTIILMLENLLCSRHSEGVHRSMPGGTIQPYGKVWTLKHITFFLRGWKCVCIAEIGLVCTSCWELCVGKLLAPKHTTSIIRNSKRSTSAH